MSSPLPDRYSLDRRLVKTKLRDPRFLVRRTFLPHNSSLFCWISLDRRRRRQYIASSALRAEASSAGRRLHPVRFGGVAMCLHAAGSSYARYVAASSSPSRKNVLLLYDERRLQFCLAQDFVDSSRDFLQKLGILCR